MIDFDLNRFVKLTAACVVLALLYVNQQIELVNRGYDLTEKHGLYGNLIDRKNANLCQVAEMASAKKMMICMKEFPDEYEMPKHTELVRITSEEEPAIMLAKETAEDHPLSWLFRPRRTAHAESANAGA